MCELTGMDVSNASMYDGASSCAEAAMMAIGATGRTGRIVISEAVHPEYIATVKTYLANQPTEIVVVPTTNGRTDFAKLNAALNDQTACVIVQSPNFFGIIEELDQAFGAAEKNGVLMVQVLIRSR